MKFNCEFCGVDVCERCGTNIHGLYFCEDCVQFGDEYCYKLNILISEERKMLEFIENHIKNVKMNYESDRLKLLTKFKNRANANRTK